MTLNELRAEMTGATVHGDGNTVVTDVQHDSRQVQPGQLFACLIGGHVDAHDFIADALSRGAAAVLAQADRAEKVPDKVPAILVPDTRLGLAEAAAALNGHPSRRLRLVGVTGTNGKSTTVAMVESIARAAGWVTGRLGTLGAVVAGQPIPLVHTTPEADDLQRLLKMMVDSGVQVAAMEVSSHGLALRRTDGTAFEVGVFTNLTQDHLDFHGTMEEYFRTKLRLFEEYPAWSTRGFTAVVNADDPWGIEVVRRAKGRVLTFGLKDHADIGARGVEVRASETRFITTGLPGALEIELPVGGAFQVANALGAIGAALALGAEPSAIVSGLQNLEPVPGRFESVPTNRPFDVIVDFAHTPDGLRSLLSSARALNPNRLLLVFGCGGNRDRTKRPIMGSIAAENADVVIVTSDNPRHEDPEAIIRDILEGIPANSVELHVDPDRRKATQLGLQLAQPGDLVILAGKGGETYMILGDERVPYDDREVVRELLETLP